MYNYYEAVKEDVIEAVTNDYDGYYTGLIREQLEMGGSDHDVVEALHDAMWIDDSITGNGSGSYWFNSWKAEEAIAHNWDLISEMASEYMMDFSVDNFSAEEMDVSIRCYLLNSVLCDLVDELIEMVEAEMEEDEMEEDEMEEDEMEEDESAEVV